MKLLHKVVKSSGGLNFSGTVSINNTVVIKEKPSDADVPSDEKLNPEEEKIRTEVENRIASLKTQLSEKQKQAFEEIEYQKSVIIKDAMKDAEKIRKDASTETLIEKETVKEQAYKDGFMQGIKDAKAQEDKYLRAAATLIAELNKSKDALYIQNENDLLDLAFEMSRKIIGKEAECDKDFVFDIAKQAAKSFRNSDYVKISLSGKDVSQSVTCDEKVIKKIAGNIPDVEIEVLSDAEKGTVILDNGKEIVDASVPTQLNLLKEIMDSSKQQ